MHTCVQLPVCMWSLEARILPCFVLQLYHTVVPIDHSVTKTDLLISKLTNSEKCHSRGELKDHVHLLVNPFIRATPRLIHVNENADCLPQREEKKLRNCSFKIEI